MRRIVVQIENQTAKRADKLASEMGVSRSELVRRALEEYLSAMRQRRFAQMKAGYRKMAAENLRLAEESLPGTEADWASYEKALAEGEPV